MFGPQNRSIFTFFDIFSRSERLHDFVPYKYLYRRQSTNSQNLVSLTFICKYKTLNFLSKLLNQTLCHKGCLTLT